MATTLPALRQRVITDLDLGYFLPTGTAGLATIPSTTTFTAPNYLATGINGGNQFSGWGIHRPDNATGAADAWRIISTVTAAGLATVAPAWADSTIGTETAELWRPYGIRPDVDFLKAANRALEFIYFSSYEPLSLAADAAMRESGVTSWGTHVNATEAKQTTAFPRTYPGFIRSLAVTNTSANGYLPTANINVEPLESIVVAALGRTNSGTGNRVDFYNVTGSATFDTAVTFSSSTWKLMVKTIQVPAGCYNINVRLGGQGASDVTDWQALWVLRPSASTPFVIPSSYINEPFEVEAVTWSRFNQGSVNNFVFEGLSMEMTEIDSADYSMNFMGPAANPSFLQFNNTRWLDGSCLPWLQLRLPYSERGTLALETDSTTAPPHLLYAATEWQLMMPIGVRQKVPQGQAVFEQGEKMFNAASKARHTDGPGKRTHDYALRGLLN